MLPVAAAMTYMMFVGFPLGASWIMNPLAACVVLATLIVFYRAAHITLGYLRFGRLSLRLLGAAPRVGGRFAAMLALPKGAETAKQVAAELVCIEHGRPYDGPAIPSAKEFLEIGAGLLKWSSGRVEFPVRRGMVAGLAAIHFPIPADLPESDPEKQSPGRICHVWELRVDAELFGPDLSRTFPVRVLKAG